MLTLYITTAIIGGILILVTAFFGGHHEVEHDVGHEISHDSDHDGHDTESALWLPFFSVRFWTYGVTFFGLTGLCLNWLTGIGTAGALPFALGVGFGIGMLAAYVMRLARKVESNSGASIRDLTGAFGRVIVGIKDGQTGKIRCSVKGELLDILAVTADNEPIELGSNVMIVQMLDDRAIVIERAEFFDETESLVQR